jgi:hypothetical protein
VGGVRGGSWTLVRGFCSPHLPLSAVGHTPLGGAVPIACSFAIRLIMELAHVAQEATDPRDVKDTSVRPSGGSNQIKSSRDRARFT